MKLGIKGQCSNCFVRLPIGRKSNYCTDCAREYNREYSKRRIESKEQREKRLARVRRYNKVNGAVVKRRWRAKHFLKANAQSITTIRLTNGELKKRPCAMCGKKAEAHHPDYRNPYKIIWLCRKHHLELHRKLRDALIESNRTSIGIY